MWSLGHPSLSSHHPPPSKKRRGITAICCCLGWEGGVGEGRKSRLISFFPTPPLPAAVQLAFLLRLEVQRRRKRKWHRSLSILHSIRTKRKPVAQTAWPEMGVDKGIERETNSAPSLFCSNGSRGTGCLLVGLSHPYFQIPDKK